MKKKALIFGITGQDGTYLANLLLKKKYQVHGVSRGKNFVNLDKLNILKSVKIHILKKNNNVKKINRILNHTFNEIYFCGGQSNVKESFFKMEYETYESQILPIQTILEFIRKSKKKIKFLYSSSSEIFGYKNKKKLKEEDNKTPLSPYALAKLAGYEIVKSYREMFKLPVFSIILFNHESPLRKNTYVIKKIVSETNKIKLGKTKKILLGNINIKRDWGWAPEYMEGFYKAMKSSETKDYIIATGKTISLKKVIKIVFKKSKLNWKKHVGYSKKNFRKHDIKENYADISLIKKKLKWSPKYKIYHIINNINRQ